MNLQFINPTFLFALFACSIPIIIHLIFKRRYQKIQWGAMQFLLAAYKKNKTSLLLENLLLLIVRCLIILLLVFIFARPIGKIMSSINALQANKSLVIVIDNSYSMGIQKNNISPFIKAKKQAQSIIKKANKNDTVSLVIMNEIPRIILSFIPISTDNKRDEILQKIENLDLSDMATNVEGSIETLKKVINEKKYSNKHLYIISDLQKNAWEGACKKSSFLQKMRYIKKNTSSFTTVDVSISDAQNIGITSLKQDGIVTINNQSRFIAKINNYGTKAYHNIDISLFTDGKKQGIKYLDLEPKEEKEIVFTPNFIKEGNHYIEIKLRPDGLLIDNTRSLSFKVINKIKLLAIDGDPKDQELESETDYLVAAIGLKPENIIQITKVNIGELDPGIKFSNYDVVVMANVQSFYDQKRYQKIQKFVKNGGGLLSSLGNNVLPQDYNKKFYRLGDEFLPGELKGEAIGNADKDKTIFLLEKIIDHRIWKYFFQNKRLIESLKKCFIYKFFPVEVDPFDNKVSVLAYYNTHSKNPAILERKYGQGKIILLTTTLDKEWNSFHSEQYGHIFVIMMHEFIKYLALPSLEENNLQTGLPFIKRFNFFIKNAQVFLPDKGIKNPKIETLEKGAAYRISYLDTQKAGIYKLKLTVPDQIAQDNSGINSQEYIVVNVNPLEGNINSINKNTLLDYLKKVDVQYKENLIEKKGKQNNKKNAEYWQYLLFALLFLALLETFLAMRFGRT